MKTPITAAELRHRADRLPRIRLTPLPTQLDDCPRLAEAVGASRMLFKRDDLTAIGMGGNKLRKLEFSLGAARAEGCDVIVHGLAGQSNYCRLTAAAAAKVGIRCVLVLRGDHKAQDPAQGNRLLDYVFGAEVRMLSADRGEQRLAKDALTASLIAEGHKPYLVGERDEAFGAVGYALCLAEIIEQAAAMGATPDCVCVSGRSGTIAGLALGKRLLGYEGIIQSFDVAPTDAAADLAARKVTAGFAAQGAKLLGFEETFTSDDVPVTADYAGSAYGTTTGAGLDAMLLLGRTEGIIVGPVYTAKGLSGMLDWLRAGKLPAAGTSVFIHTGGTPETFAYNREIMDHLHSTM